MTEQYGNIILIGRLTEVNRLIKQFAYDNEIVLIRGETGTGKELVARAIHYESKRDRYPFEAVNFAELKNDLSASRLYGHKRGAFTGAVENREGAIKTAGEGTILLDEIGDFPLDLQPTLLRFLDSGEYYRIGDDKIHQSKARIIAATNQDLEDMMGTGKFRGDLYHRINVLQIYIPPLRERKEDIQELTTNFIIRYLSGIKNGGCRDNTFSLEEGFIEALQNYNWPGNVRELENTIKRVVRISGDDNLFKKDLLPIHIIENREDTYFNQPQSDLNSLMHSVAEFIEEIPGLSLWDIQDQIIRAMIDLCNGNKTKAADKLGISVRTISFRLKR